LGHEEVAGEPVGGELLGEGVGDVFGEEVEVVAYVEACGALADAGVGGFEMGEREIPEALDRVAGVEEAKGEIVFFGLHEEVGGEQADLVEGGFAEAGAGADEDVGVGGGFFGAVGEGDVEDGGGELGVVAEVADHLGGGAGMRVGIVVEEHQEFAFGFSHGDVFGDWAAVFGEADELGGGAFWGEEVGGAVGGGVVDDEDFELGGGEAVGEDFLQAIDHYWATVVGGDAEADKGV